MSDPAVNFMAICANGPLDVHADIAIDGAFVGTNAALCRCGASLQKPYCDGSHKTSGFSDNGEPPGKSGAPLAARDGRIEIVPLLNGPLQMSGNLELRSNSGLTVDSAEKMWLCRCGQSKKKPYCDGTHKSTGFQASGERR